MDLSFAQHLVHDFKASLSVAAAAVRGEGERPPLLLFSSTGAMINLMISSSVKEAKTDINGGFLRIIVIMKRYCCLSME
eukprot:CAMPEP_0118704284 /NCGR_PEP_ID=MMETSP0800-20121206/19134_1 /TAXON_ID=210618 ORGANISM="Striatella unipunctata, Strain CCMP2910" /NCGR_SAMPLE_ID=MMETSP0800 /ASSEMBLY_ACC=CAM_ASM_000638 /LENGTH=78 /DNA_ID=CAMNT_0006606125 /DNA_START=186 /DNA_END=422 /DNA_ORIENTATION=-